MGHGEKIRAAIARGQKREGAIFAYCAHRDAMTLARLSSHLGGPADLRRATGRDRTRVRVTDVLEMLAGGASPSEIAADFPYLSEDDVREVLVDAVRTGDLSI